MNKRIIFILSLAAAMSLSACGEVGGTITVEDISSASAEDQTPDSPETPENDTPYEEDADPTDSEQEGSGDQSEAASAPDTEQPFTFATPNGDFTYEQLYDMGLANFADGVYFALIPEGGGAGHAYYSVFTSADGMEWEQGEPYSELNGKNIHIALDDGRILLFSYMTAACEPYPVAYVLELSRDGVAVEEKPHYFDALTFEDGSPLDAYGEVAFGVIYEGGYSFRFSFSGAEGGTLNEMYELDPETLEI